MRLLEWRRLAFAFVCVTLLATCADDETVRPADAEMDAGGAGQPGGSGGSHGGDGGNAGDGGTSHNRPPIANAGEDQVASSGDTVALDGSGSTDADSNPLTYRWRLEAPVGSSAALSDSRAPAPSFVVDVEGVYRAVLIVNDGMVDSAPDEALVSTTGNLPPVADAGEDQSVKVGANVALDGSSSHDPNGDAITFTWELVARPDGSQAQLSDPNAMKPTLTPDVAGDYRIELVVSDGVSPSDPDSVLVRAGDEITPANVPPVAEIADVSEPFYVDQSLALDGRSSHDVDGDTLTYEWSLTSRPQGSKATFSDANSAQPSFEPDVRGPFVVQLIVHDGVHDSEPVTKLLVPGNRVPTSGAGQDATAREDDTVPLDGSASSDPDHDTLTYAWSITAAPAGSMATLLGSTTATPTLVPDLRGEYRIALVVSDGELDSVADELILTITPGRPRILGFTPMTTSWGTLVDIEGQRLAPATGAPRVLLKQRDGGTLEAPVAHFGDDGIQIVVPAGADTGLISLEIADENVASSDPLTIVPSSSFELTAVPAAVDIIQGQSAAFMVRLQSDDGFPLLAPLSVAALPAGISASFTPASLAAGQWSLLTVTADGTQPPGNISFEVHASAAVDGQVIERKVTLVARVQPVTTAFIGRAVVDDQSQTPLAGVTVTLLPRDGDGQMKNCSGATTTDAAGNFAFTNLPAGCDGAQMVHYDGLTATEPLGDYAGVDLVYDIVPGQVSVSPTLIHLPRIDDAEKVMVHQNYGSDQTFTFASIRDLSVTVYAGTTLRLADGSTPDPFPLVAIQVPVDRLPDEVPVSTQGFHYFIVAFQPANAAASQPVAVSFPNQMQQAPGTASPLITLDPTRGVMVQYGTGAVSADGSQIVPDADPAHAGHLYGLVHFDWHGAFGTADNPTNPNDCGGGDPSRCNDCKGGPPKEGEPIDLATGIAQLRSTDLELNGSRGSVAIARSYRTLTVNRGPFGLGSALSYAYQLTTNSPSGAQSLTLVLPNGARAIFSRQPDEGYTNAAVPWLQGAVFRTSGNTAELHWKDGTVYIFTPYNFQLGSLLTQIIDRNRNTISLVRDGARPVRITQIVDPAGRRLLLSYDSSDRVTQISDPIGRTVSYTYNANDLLETFTDAAGGVHRYVYDAQNRLLEEWGPRGTQIAKNTYDANSRVIQQVLASDGVLHFDYTLTNPGVPQSPVLATAFTDPLGRTEIYRFNPQGFLLSETDALGQTRAYERAGGGNLITAITGGSGCASCGSQAGDVSYAYDGNGNETERADALGRTQTTYASAFGNPLTVRDALDHVTAFQYDNKGSLTRVTDPLGHATRYEHDANGLVTAVIDALGNRETLEYDGFGNLIARTDPLGNTTHFRYDAVSRLLEVLDPLGRTTGIEYDNLDRVVSTTDGRGYTTSFAYDPIGNLLSVSDAKHHTTTFHYDAAGRQDQRTDPLQRSESWHYDLNGNLTTHTDRRGLEARFDYDEAGRLVKETYADSTVTRSYDATGRLVHATDTMGGDMSFEYDPIGSLHRSVGPVGTIDYVRDALGRALSRQVLGQDRLDYNYDAAGNLTRAALPGLSVDLVYDELNRLAREARANGVDSSYGYDAAGRMTSIVHQGPSGVLDSQVYEYDAAGSRTAFSSAFSAPLVTKGIENTGYDDANEISSWGQATFSHDANGNRLAEIDSLGTTSYAWDSRDRMTSIERPGSPVIKLAYDFAGNLTHIWTSQGEEAQLIDDIANMAWRKTPNGSGEVTLSGRAIDAQLGLANSDGSVLYALLTTPNSTAAITDGAADVVSVSAYEPFGSEITGSVDYPFRFTGRTKPVPHDSLMYYRARFYDPGSGRFLSEDPLRISGGSANPYRYADNNPVEARDPTGLFTYGLMPRNSRHCNDYDPCESYMGANARCFCKCAGNSPWSQHVRSCLRGFYSSGLSGTLAHHACYQAATVLFGPPPPELLFCYARCLRLK